MKILDPESYNKGLASSAETKPPSNKKTDINRASRLFFVIVKLINQIQSAK